MRISYQVNRVRQGCAYVDRKYVENLSNWFLMRYYKTVAVAVIETLRNMECLHRKSRYRLLKLKMVSFLTVGKSLAVISFAPRTIAVISKML